MRRVTDDAGNWLEDNGYGASREKIFQNSQGVLTWYVWGGDAVISEYTAASWGGGYTWAKSYVYAGSRLLSTFAANGTGGETLEFHHPDRLGTRMVTDPAADTLYLQSTLPFGTAFAAETTGSSNRLFTTYDRSPSTGLDYAVNRTYSPGQGRFITVDPIGMASVSPFDPQSLNLYAFVQNNPISFTDPNGLDDLSAEVQFAQDLLNFGPCRSLFSKKANPSQTLGRLFRNGQVKLSATVPILSSDGQVVQQNGSFNGQAGYTPIRTNPRGKRLAPSGIYINSESTLFTAEQGTMFGVNGLPGGGFPLDAISARALLIIHELVHWMGNWQGNSYFYDGHPNDLDPQIYVRCFLLNPAWRSRAEPVEPAPAELETQIIMRPLIPLTTDYPSWWYDMWAFIHFIDSIPVGGEYTSVRVISEKDDE